MSRFSVSERTCYETRRGRYASHLCISSFDMTTVDQKMTHFYKKSELQNIKIGLTECWNNIEKKEERMIVKAADVFS